MKNPYKVGFFTINIYKTNVNNTKKQLVSFRLLSFNGFPVFVYYRSDETGKPLKLSKRKETNCFFVLLIYNYLYCYSSRLTIKECKPSYSDFCAVDTFSSVLCKY